MDLRDAYRVLEVASGAGEDAVREARKTLSKVWHPDRYATDPALQAKAEIKLREINEAFDVIRSARFPAAPAAAKPAPAPMPAPAAPPKPPPPVASTIDFVPRRRVRWPVLLGVVVALGIGAYFAILQLGASRDATPVAVVRDAGLDAARPDAALVVVVAPADAARPPPPTPDLPRPIDVPAGSTFTLGASQAQVIELQGAPNNTQSISSQSSTTVNGHEVSESVARTTLRYGRSEIELVDDKVVGWWDNDVRLRVRITPRDPAAVAAARARGTLAIGQSADDALGVLGMPSRVAHDRWSYGTSELALDDAGKIIHATPGDTDLHLRQ